jgi:hypothetical protein
MSTTPPNPPLPVGQESDRPLGDATSSIAPTPMVIPDLIELSSGKELDEAGASKLQASLPVRLIVVAGPVGCGKTTLITSLYELFQWGKVSDYFFAGSSTLPAFERRCYLSRTASQRSMPDTERTLLGDVRYLHLRIWKDNFAKGPLDLLFTDVSGEAFEHARDSVVECQRLHFLHQTDHFLLLLDSEKLVNKEQRWRVAHESMTLLRTCLDSQMLNRTSLVDVLWTKFDYFLADQDQQKLKFLDSIKAEFETEFSSRVGRLTFSQIAARPTETDTVEFGHGIANLLEDWATVSPRERPMNILPSNDLGSRESESFASRHFNQTEESE